jgi:hypothetical protein
LFIFYFFHLTGGTANAANNNMQKSKSSSNVGNLVSKKIWKSRSKSQIRAQQIAAASATAQNVIPPPGSAIGPDGLPLKSQWTPQVDFFVEYLNNMGLNRNICPSPRVNVFGQPITVIMSQ